MSTTAPTSTSTPTPTPTPTALITTIDEGRWLSDTEQQTWRGFLRILQLLPTALDRQLQVDAGIPHAYYMILAMLSEAPDRELRMSDLSQTTAASLSRLSHAVARLEEYGWVTRRRCANDRRGQIARLTDAGMERLVELAPGHVAAVRQFVFDALSTQQLAQLDAITAAVADAIAAAGRVTGKVTGKVTGQVPGQGPVSGPGSAPTAR